MFNFDIIAALNGQEAYEAVINNLKNNNNSFDIVLLDLDMPIMNGYEACTNIV